jgi:hypothetical protein
MHSCPQPGKWAIAVWGGSDGTDADEAFATCGEGAVAAAYYVDAQTGAWLRWFAGRPEVSSLSMLNNMQGVIALGTIGPPASAARIAFVSDRDGNTEIYVMNADGTGQTRLTKDPGSDWSPVWSPDGTKIAFSRAAIATTRST